MNSEGWATHRAIKRKSGIYLSDDWMDLFRGDLPSVIVLWVYAFTAREEDPDEYIQLDEEAIRAKAKNAMSLKTIRARRKQLIELKILVPRAGSPGRCSSLLEHRAPVQVVG